MHAFQRCAHHQGVRPRHLEQGGAFDDQKRPEALAAIEARIAHGLDQPRRPAQFARFGLCRQKPVEQNLDIGGHRIEAGKRRLAGDTARAATSDEVKDLKRQAQDLKEVVAEQALELRLLKKSMIGDGGDPT